MRAVPRLDNKARAAAPNPPDAQTRGPTLVAAAAAREARPLARLKVRLLGRRAGAQGLHLGRRRAVLLHRRGGSLLPRARVCACGGGGMAGRRSDRRKQCVRAAAGAEPGRGSGGAAARGGLAAPRQRAPPQGPGAGAAGAGGPGAPPPAARGPAPPAPARAIPAGVPRRPLTSLARLRSSRLSFSASSICCRFQASSLISSSLNGHCDGMPGSFSRAAFLPLLRASFFFLRWCSRTFLMTYKCGAGPGGDGGGSGRRRRRRRRQAGGGGRRKAPL
jgi:hypothetical protein